MSETLSPSARRVQERLQAVGYETRVLELPKTTRTAVEAAAAIGCQVEQIVKSLVFRGEESGRALLVIASGTNRVDERRLAELVGEPVGKANADFVREQTGFAIGGVPPLGHRQPLDILIDEDLLGYDEVWAAGGTPNAVFRLSGRDLPRITGGRVAAIS